MAMALVSNFSCVSIAGSRRRIAMAYSARRRVEVPSVPFFVGVLLNFSCPSYTLANVSGCMAVRRNLACVMAVTIARRKDAALGLGAMGLTV